MAGIIKGVWRQSHRVPIDVALEFNNWVTTNGEPGPKGGCCFIAEEGRYQYYLSRGCPNCHRVAIANTYFRTSDIFDYTFVDDVKRENGWRIRPGDDPIYCADRLQDIMVAAEGKITALCTVPLLLDKKTKRIVSNNSSDMVRMMDIIAEQRLGGGELKLWPEEISSDVDEMNNWIRSNISSGIYDVLFSDSNISRDHANMRVIQSLEYIDRRLANSKYLFGSYITASDLWIFPTLLRMNSIYSEIFGLTVRINSFKYIGNYLRELWKVKQFHTASDLDLIEKHYYYSLIYGPNGPVEPGSGKKPDPLKRFILTDS